MPDTLLDAALDYARRGWPVFPLRVRGKEPLIPGGFHKASTDENAIRTWWSRWPEANIGVPAGAGTFCVVDIDPAKGGEDSLTSLREEHEPIPDTLRQITGSGGLHYCFRPDPAVGNTESRIAPGIDTRGDDKGYIVVAPSVHPNGRAYQWENPGAALAEIPSWLIPTSRTAEPPRQGIPAAPPTLSVTPAYPDQGEREIRARYYLRECPPAVQGSGGHAALLWACTAMRWGFELDEGATYRLLSEEYNPRCVPPWDLSDEKDRREFLRKIQEGTRNKANPRGWLMEEWNRNQSILLRSGSAAAEALIREVSAPAIPAPQPSAPSSALLQPPGFMGDLCGWINARARKKQPLLTLGNVLAFLGTLFGRKIRDDWDTRTNLYCLGVGASSCGKDHSRRMIKDLCAAAGVADTLLGGEEVTSDTAIAAALKDRPSCLFQWDEIGHMIASMKDKYSSGHRKTIVPMLMKLYSSANTVYLGKEYAAAERQDIVQPNMCVYGTTVPDTLWKGLSTDEIRDGFLGRMLVFISRDDDPEVDDANSRITEVPKDLVERVHYWHQYKPAPPVDAPDILRLTDIFQVTIPTDAEAQDRFLQFRNEVKRIRNASSDQRDSATFLWGRAEENARKVALIVAAGDATTAESARITEYHADYACRLVETLLTDFGREVNDSVADSRIELVVQKVEAWIRERGDQGLTRETITNRLRNPFERNAAIDDLVKEERIFQAVVNGKKTFFVPPFGLKHLAAGNGAGKPAHAQ